MNAASTRLSARIIGTIFHKLLKMSSMDGYHKPPVTTHPQRASRIPILNPSPSRIPPTRGRVTRNAQHRMLELIAGNA